MSTINQPKWRENFTPDELALLGDLAPLDDQKIAEWNKLIHFVETSMQQLQQFCDQNMIADIPNYPFAKSLDDLILSIWGMYPDHAIEFIHEQIKLEQRIENQELTRQAMEDAQRAKIIYDPQDDNYEKWAAFMDNELDAKITPPREPRPVEISTANHIASLIHQIIEFAKVDNWTAAADSANDTFYYLREMITEYQAMNLHQLAADLIRIKRLIGDAMHRADVYEFDLPAQSALQLAGAEILNY